MIFHSQENANVATVGAFGLLLLSYFKEISIVLQFIILVLGVPAAVFGLIVSYRNWKRGNKG
jgi:hypothetical protein